LSPAAVVAMPRGVALAHPTKLTLMNNRAVFLCRQGQVIAAQEFLQQRLAELKDVSEFEDKVEATSRVADCVRRVTGDVRETGDLDQAKSYLHEALEIAEGVAEKDPADVAARGVTFAILQDLAGVSAAHGDEESVTALYLRVVDSIESINIWLTVRQPCKTFQKRLLWPTIKSRAPSLNHTSPRHYISTPESRGSAKPPSPLNPQQNQVSVT
jgi:hypothetical protein